MSTTVTNEFLCFLSIQFDKLDRENLISTLGDFYSFREALEAKNILIAECEKVGIVDSIKDFSVKRIEGRAGALRRVVIDAVDVWTVVDCEKAGKLSVTFVAENVNRLPGVNIEKFNVQSLFAAIVKAYLIYRDSSRTALEKVNRS